MPNLKDIQEQFQNFLLRGEPQIEEMLGDPLGGTVEQRLAVYRDAYYLRLINILETDYPRLKKYMGEQAFAKLAYQYIKTFPSKNFSIAFFGKHLSEYLIQTPVNFAALGNRAWRNVALAEMAAFEWCVSECVNMPTTTLLTQTQLQLIDKNEWPDLVFQFIPSVRLLKFCFNIFSICEAIENNKKIPSLKNFQKPQHVIVWQKNYESYYCRFSVKELVVFAAIKEQKTFAEICEELCRFLSATKAAEYLLLLLLRWLELGLLAGI